MSKRTIKGWFVFIFISPSFPKPQVVHNDDAGWGAVKDQTNGGQGCRVECRIRGYEVRQGELETLENGFGGSWPDDIHKRGFHEVHDNLRLQIGEPAQWQSNSPACTICHL